MSSQSISVILLAGGIGSRMKSPIPKQFLSLRGKPVIQHSLEFFASFEEVKEIIIVCDPSYNAELALNVIKPRLAFAPPGKRRQDSLENGLQKVSAMGDLICVHDAARPLLKHADFERLLKEAKIHRTVALALPVKYTIKQAGADGFVLSTLDRSTLWEMQTPQIAPLELLQQGFAIAKAENLTVSDDVALVELTGHPVKLVSGSPSNIKLTTVEDWATLETLLAQV